MTQPSELLRPSPAQLQHAADAALFKALAEFQGDSLSDQPVEPRLPAVLAEAANAFTSGISYSTTRWADEITVTIHHSEGGELGSSAPFPGYGAAYSTVVAQLLAGLLGIPLADEHTAADSEQLEPKAVWGPMLQACGMRSVTITDVQQPAPAPEPAPEPTPGPAAAEPEPEELPDDPEPSEDPERALAADEIATAIAMVKAMEEAQRRAFTAAFRTAFSIPREVKQVSSTITQLKHLHFIDRFTTEAAGGVAP